MQAIGIVSILCQEIGKARQMDASHDASILMPIILFACNFSKNLQSSVSKLDACVFTEHTQSRWRSHFQKLKIISVRRNIQHAICIYESEN